MGEYTERCIFFSISISIFIFFSSFYAFAPSQLIKTGAKELGYGWDMGGTCMGAIDRYERLFGRSLTF